MTLRAPLIAAVLAAATAVTAAQTGQPPRPPAPAGRGGQIAMNTPPREIPLWEGGAPGALGTDEADRPTVTFYPAARRPSGTAVVIAPGGGYGALAMDHEGRQVASLFNSMGVAAFVLKYRLGPRYHHPVELGDGLRAMRTARARAEEFGLDPSRIGMMGFSAGGHLASTVATHFDAGQPGAADVIERVSSRPDFLILGYPVISSDPAIAHAGSFRNLLGDNPDPALLQDLSNDRRVTADTPPTFLFHTNADTGVPAENSVRFYLALRKAKVPAELHVFENGPHGVGLAMDDPALSLWPTLLTNWLRGRGLLSR